MDFFFFFPRQCNNNSIVIFIFIIVLLLLDTIPGTIAGAGLSSSSSSSSSGEEEYKSGEVVQEKDKEEEEKEDDVWSQWTCKELTPDLCELDIETGSFNSRGIDVHYWIYRQSHNSTSSSSSSSSSLPIITLHGGPSLPHNYMLPIQQLACRDGSPDIIFYDQAGCGKSSIIIDDDDDDEEDHQSGTTEAEAAAVPRSTINISKDYPWLLDPFYYAKEELPALISHLGINQYHLLGHSWGTILAQLYVLPATATNTANTTTTTTTATYIPKLSSSLEESGLVSLILSGPLSDAKTCMKAQWDETEGNLITLPPFIQERIHTLSNKNQYDSNDLLEYEAITSLVTSFFACRTFPPPDCFIESMNGMNGNIYTAMQGPSDFVITGVMASFNITSQLQKIKIPVLLTSGQFDTIRPSIVQTMYKQMKSNSEHILLPHSGHFSMIDDPKLFNTAVYDFVNRVETNWKKNQSFIPSSSTTHPMNGNIKNGNDEEDVEEEEEEEDVISKSEWYIFAITALIAFGFGLVVDHWFHVFERNRGYQRI